MRYTTTSCRNCGFKTRSHESNVPNVQIGSPILRCPRCGNLILDGIATEYEFMTDKERAKFTTENARTASYPGNILFIIVGFALLIGGIVLGGGYIAAGLIFGGGCILLGISRIIKNNKMSSEQIIEQAVYESLQRTKNSDYVEFIKQSYSANEIKRQYRTYAGKDVFMNKYKIFETRESYIDNMKEFNKLIELIGVDECVEKSETTTFINP